MGKVKISAAQKASCQKRKKISLKGFKRAHPLDYLTNEKNVGLAILECLQNNDPKGVMEAIIIYTTLQ